MQEDSLKIYIKEQEERYEYFSLWISNKFEFFFFSLGKYDKNTNQTFWETHIFFFVYFFWETFTSYEQKYL